MDIIVTTPKSEIANAAAEAADCIAAGGGEYFRRFPVRASPRLLRLCERVYYVEDGYVRGFGTVKRKECIDVDVLCDTTYRHWPPGTYVFMDATSWQWIRPIPMRAFQGFRYVDEASVPFDGDTVEIIGDWRDPKPEIPGTKKAEG